MDVGLAALKASLGDRWQKTVIIAASEFGRTAKENGTKGTDHGTGNVMFVGGGALPSLKGAGGKVIANWPGLSQSQLYEGRDLNPTTDMRSVIKGMLNQHLLVDVKQLNTIFPDSADIRPMNLV